jgi:hypothetical protein
MIRLATSEDTSIAIELLRRFLLATSYSQAEEASKDRQHLAKLVWTCQQYGFIWLAFVNEEPAGILMSLKEPNIWFPKKIQFRELVWFVLPEYRSSSIGGKLFINYCKKAEELKEKGLIEGYFTTKMTTTDSIDLERRGFRLTESTYIKE